MIFIDPSELRETSNLKTYLDFDYKTLDGLESATGADVMISPDGLPLPWTPELLALHIKSGAKLIQVKFGLDLTASVADGRLYYQLSRMLTAGAMSWQSLLLFVGIFSFDSSQGMATINGQLSYSDPPMRWKAVQAALTFWVERGGSLDFPLASGKLIGEHFAIHQDHINRFRNGKNTKTLWPQKVAYYEEIEAKSQNAFIGEWQAAQKIKLVEDLRVLLCAIPGAGIGPEKATAIFEYMAANGYRQDFGGFLQLLEADKLLAVPGIGEKTIDKIRWGLWRTPEERQKKSES